MSENADNGMSDEMFDLIGKNIKGIEEDRKEPCIHCGDVWYSIHYKDGVCHKCQEKGLPGRTEIAKKRRSKSRRRLLITAAILILGIIVLLLPHASTVN